MVDASFACGPRAAPASQPTQSPGKAKHRPSSFRYLGKVFYLLFGKFLLFFFVNICVCINFIRECLAPSFRFPLSSDRPPVTIYWPFSPAHIVPEILRNRSKRVMSVCVCVRRGSYPFFIWGFFACVVWLLLCDAFSCCALVSFASSCKLRKGVECVRVLCNLLL